MRRWLAVACLLPVVGCVPELDGTCTSDDACRPGQVCRSSYCVAPSAGDDAAIGGDADTDGTPGPDAVTDAGPPHDATPVDRGPPPDGAIDASPPHDASGDDAAPHDADGPDASATDAGPDAEPVDATPDGEPPDGGPRLDAEPPPDASPDAGPPTDSEPVPDATAGDAEPISDAGLDATPEDASPGDAGRDDAAPDDAAADDAAAPDDAAPDAGPMCGNGVVDPGEECDAPGGVLLTRCTAQCRVTATGVSGDASLDRDIQAGSFALFQVSAERTATLGISTAVEGGCPPTLEVIVEDADGATVATATGGPDGDCPVVSFPATWMPYRVEVRDTVGAAVTVETTFTVSDTCGNDQVEGDEQCDGGAGCQDCLLTACGPWDSAEPDVDGALCRPAPLDLDCPAGALALPSGGCSAALTCPAGWQRVPDAFGCAPGADPGCPDDQVRLPDGTCTAAWPCVGTGPGAWTTPRDERFGCFPPRQSCDGGTVPSDGDCVPAVPGSDCRVAPPALENWLVVDATEGDDGALGGAADPLATLDEAIRRVRATMTQPPALPVYPGIFLIAGEHAATADLPDIVVEGAGAGATTLTASATAGEGAGPLRSATLRCLTLRGPDDTALTVRGVGEVNVENAILEAAGPVIDMRDETTLNVTYARLTATVGGGMRTAGGAVSLMQFVEIVAPGVGVQVSDPRTEVLAANAVLRGPGPGALALDDAYLELLGVIVSGAGNGGAALRAADGGEINIDRLLVRDTQPGSVAVSVGVDGLLTVGDVLLRDNPGGHVLAAGRAQPLELADRRAGNLTIRGAGIPLRVMNAGADVALERLSIGGAGPTPAVRVDAGRATLDWLDVADRAAPAAQETPVLQVADDGALTIEGGLVEAWDAPVLDSRGITDLRRTLWRAPAAPRAGVHVAAGRSTLADVQLPTGVRATATGTAVLTRVHLRPVVEPGLSARDGGTLEVAGVRVSGGPIGAEVESALQRASLTGAGLFLVRDGRGPGLLVGNAATVNLVDVTIEDSVGVALRITGDGALAELRRAVLDGAAAHVDDGPGRLVAAEGGARVVLNEALLRGAAEHGLQAFAAVAELTDARIEGGAAHGIVGAGDARVTAIDLRVDGHAGTGVISRFGAMSLTRTALVDNDVGLRFARSAEPVHVLRWFEGNRIDWQACGLLCPLAGPLVAP